MPAKYAKGVDLEQAKDVSERSRYAAVSVLYAKVVEKPHRGRVNALVLACFGRHFAKTSEGRRIYRLYSRLYTFAVKHRLCERAFNNNIDLAAPP